jgi:amino acid transporter
MCAAAGMVWMQCIVAVAALIGIVTTLTVGLYSLSRVVMAASRDWLLPPFLARISPRTHTPLVAQLVFGVIIGGLGVLNLMSVHTEFAPCSAANLPCCPCSSWPAALLAMLVEVDAATSLVAFGTLVTLWMVCNVQLFRRYYPEVQMRFTRQVLALCAPIRMLKGMHLS